MTGWLIVNEYLNTDKFKELHELFIEAAKVKGIRLIKYTNADFLVRADVMGAITPADADVFSSKACLGADSASDTDRDLNVSIVKDGIEKPDFIIFYDKDLTLAKAFEDAGLKVFNSHGAIRICDSKVLSAKACAEFNYNEEKAGSGKFIRCPKTYAVPFSYENVGICEDDRFMFLSILEKEIRYPIIIKESKSSFGMGVRLAHTHDDAVRIISEIGSHECIIQEYISPPRDEGCLDDNALNEKAALKNDKGLGKDCPKKVYYKSEDVRLQMVGHKCVAAMKRSNDNDFRANLTNGGIMSTYTPTEDDLETAKNAMDAIGLSFAGIDIMHDAAGKAVFCEANSNAHFKNLYDLTGINAAEEIFEYIKNQLN